MNHYPIIARLSTLGLRQHQEFDYDFHDFRTDFIGESGAGKSMIADLLQLILVGSEAFESATAAMGGKRTPDGMVLRMPDARGTDIGYAFLNVQLSRFEFVVIGTYIQSTGRSTVSFTIQHGFEEDELKPLKQLLSYTDFLQDDKIIPLDELVIYLESKGFACKTWQRRKQFHKFLYQHELLSLDLSENEKVLKDYASIIHSFSRGHSVETQKGSALKDFLFGDEAAKKIYANYQSAVNELQDGVAQYAKNKSEIDLITRKQHQLSQLLTLERDTVIAKYNSLLHDLRYTRQEKERWEREVVELGTITRTNYSSLLVIRNILEQLAENSKQKKEAQLGQFNRMLQEYTVQEKKWDDIRLVDTWLVRYNTGIDHLLSIYQRHVELKRYAAIWKRISQMIDGKGVSQLLESLLPVPSASELVNLLEKEIQDMRSAVKDKQDFQQFMDINNTGSLGSWALTQNRGFTLEEESIIMYFKHLSTRKPGGFRKGILRYIPSPEMLLRSFSIAEPDDEGGWLHLNGIREYITWVPKQILSESNQQHIRHFFQQETKNIGEQIKTLEGKINANEQLKKIVIGEDFESYLQSLKLHDQILALREEDDFTNQGEPLIREYINQYYLKETVEEVFLNAKQDKDEALNDLQEANGFHTAIAALFDQVKKILDDDGRDISWQEVFDGVLPPLKNILLMEQEQRYLRESLERQADVVRFMTDKIEVHRKNLNTLSLKNAYGELKEAEEEYRLATNEFRNAYETIPEAAFEDKSHLADGNQLRIAYQSKKSEFETVYKAIVESFISNDSYRFANVYDTKELSMALLPAVFQGLEVTTTNVIESIERYLAKINDKNRELNKRKFQKINDLLDQVMEEVNDRLSLTRRIDFFLNEEEKAITGGHRVRLQSSSSGEFSTEWISRFQTMLSEGNRDLLDSDHSTAISLEEKMLQAFSACSTSRNRPKVEKLLDPNAYFGLEFSMKSENGSVNKGSSGQSYAGIALLCIARLHIIGAGMGAKERKGIRFMPIDEAEGLGSNYDMLYNIAKEYKYQIVSFAINPLGAFIEGELFMYMLSKDLSSKEDINNMPLAIRCEQDMDLLN